MSQTAESTLMPTSRVAKMKSAFLSVIRDSQGDQKSVRIASGSGWANQFHHGAEHVVALERFGQGARCAERNRLFRRGSGVRAEVPGDGDDRNAGTKSPDFRNHGGA